MARQHRVATCGQVAAVKRDTTQASIRKGSLAACSAVKSIYPKAQGNQCKAKDISLHSRKEYKPCPVGWLAMRGSFRPTEGDVGGQRGMLAKKSNDEADVKTDYLCAAWEGSSDGRELNCR
ncbi:hypothetical protein F5Y05DRAFT_392955 [Hypoxylon sp. FL0543]|nr:hypothetical protein F5Y05DRAFT_392955 [Hypoxylon sp. FL0543]